MTIATPERLGNFVQGQSTFSSPTASLSDFNSDSPTTVGSETVTIVAGGANPIGSGSCYKWTISTGTSNEVGVHKDLSGTKTRDFQFTFLLDAGATLNGEETI